jgi:glycosyltransferase involved in cell wall biosynthesis
VHIVHLIARLNDGGPARVVCTLAEQMRALGHNVTVLAGVCAADEPDLTGHLRARGLTVQTIATLGRGIAPADLSAFVTIIGDLRRLRPDVVHTHTAKAGALGRLACRLGSWPCLHTFHGHVLNGYFPGPVNLLIASAERMLAGVAHHQALTQSQMITLHQRWGIGRPGTWHCLPIPVEPVQLQPAAWQQQLRPGIPVIGYLGRFAAIKDPFLWLESLSVLSRRYPVQGVMCGHGDLASRIRELAQRRGLTVLFPGSVPAGEALFACDVLMLSSHNEGLPLVAVEAGGAGVPVVAPLVGGLCDLADIQAIEGVQRSATALADGCMRIIYDRDLRLRRIGAGRRLAARLAPKALAPRYDMLYRAIAAGG